MPKKISLSTVPQNHDTDTRNAQKGKTIVKVLTANRKKVAEQEIGGYSKVAKSQETP